MSTASDELLRLTALLERANHEYYVLEQPALSDAEYDALMRRVRELTEQHPELAPLAVSVTEAVGAGEQARTPFVKQRHMVPMLSLQNAMSVAEFEAWHARARAYTDREDMGALCAELKIDGLSMSLTYEKGKLVRGTTRGDGLEGEDVTLNVRQIAAIPAKLSVPEGQSVPEVCEVRGEVYLPRTSFAAINTRREAAELDPYRNPRNAASGSLRVIDPTVTRDAGLGFFAYGLVLPADAPPETIGLTSHGSILDRLESWSFTTSPHRCVINSLAESEAFAETIPSLRASLDFDIDGVVFKMNSIAMQKMLGAVSREPRWAVARKWPVEAIETTLREVRYQVGRTGRITPVAVVDPTEIGGVTVTNATLHNADYIRALDLRIGDRVLLTRAGEVIPQILGVVPEKRTGKEVAVQFVSVCPDCGHALERRADEADTFCVSATCPPQQIRRTMHAGSRKALDIRGLGAEVAEQLHTAGAIQSWADLWSLTAVDLAKLEGFAETKTQNLLSAIAARKNPPLARFLIALGVPDLGETVSQKLAAKFGTLTAVRAADAATLEALPGIGKKIAIAVTAAFGDPVLRQQLDRLESLGVVPQAEVAAPPTATTLEGMTFVITGTLSVSRDALTEEIKQLGGAVTGSVSKKTTYLVAGADVGAGKSEKAVSLGVTVLSESGLRTLIASRQTAVSVGATETRLSIPEAVEPLTPPSDTTLPPTEVPAEAATTQSSSEAKDQGPFDLFGQVSPPAAPRRRKSR